MEECIGHGWWYRTSLYTRINNKSLFSLFHSYSFAYVPCLTYLFIYYYKYYYYYLYTYDDTKDTQTDKLEMVMRTGSCLILPKKHIEPDTCLSDHTVHVGEQILAFEAWWQASTLSGRKRPWPQVPKLHMFQSPGEHKPSPDLHICHH